jgi:hypothetical protein
MDAEFIAWKTWGDVPDNVKAQLHAAPSRNSYQLESDLPFAEALRRIVENQ